jgi:hypothetical protein
MVVGFGYMMYRAGKVEEGGLANGKDITLDHALCHSTAA